MSSCRSCGKPIPPNRAACMYCGAPLVEQKVVACSKCKRNNPPTVAACQYCGTNLGGAAASGAKPMQAAELKDANEVRIEAAIKACMVDRDYNRAISLFDDILDEVDAGLRSRPDNLKLQSQRQRIMAFMPMIEKMKGQTPVSQTPAKQVRHVMVLDPNEKDPVAAIKAKIDEIRAAHVQPPAASMPVEEIKRAVFALAAKKDLASQSVIPPPRPGGALAEPPPAFKQIFIKMQEQALEALKRNQKEEALGILDGSIRYNPGLPGAYMAKAQLLKQLGRNQEAVAALDQGLQIGPREPDLWFEKADALDNLGRAEEAALCYLQALDHRPNESRAWCDLGHVLGKLQSQPEAYACLENAVHFKPDSAVAWFNKGGAESKAGRYEDAIRSFERFLALNPPMKAQVQTVLQMLPQLKGALAKQKGGLPGPALAPLQGGDQTEEVFTRARAFDNQGRYAEALALYDQVLARDPNSAGTLHNKGICLENMGRYAEALPCYDRALAIDAGLGLTWGQKAVCLQRLGRMPEALPAAQRACELCPASDFAWSVQGRCLFAMQRLDEALASYERAIELNENYAGNWTEAAAVLLSLGRAEDARKSALRATEADARSPHAWLALANAEEKLGHAKEAQDARQKARPLGH